MDDNEKVIVGNLNSQFNNAAKYLESPGFIDEDKISYIAAAHATIELLRLNPTSGQIQQASTTMLFLQGMIEQSKLATIDPLTEIKNRRAFTNDLEAATKSHCDSLNNHRSHNIKKAIVFIDLDYFKEINDNLGHLAGDNALIKSAEILTNASRAEESVYRLGGDEFALMLNFESDAKEVDIDKAIERFKNSMSELTIEHNGQERPLQASMGVHIINGDETEDDLKELADKSLYEDKKSKDDRQEKVWGIINIRNTPENDDTQPS